jgi:hypothetical protein
LVWGLWPKPRSTLFLAPLRLAYLIASRLPNSGTEPFAENKRLCQPATYVHEVAFAWLRKFLLAFTTKKLRDFKMGQAELLLVAMFRNRFTFQVAR